MTVPCWMFRYEAEGFNERYEWIAAQPLGAEIEPEGWSWDRAGDMCNLDEDHAGPHVFTPQDEIVLVFR